MKLNPLERMSVSLLESLYDERLTILSGLCMVTVDVHNITFKYT